MLFVVGQTLLSAYSFIEAAWADLAWIIAAAAATAGAWRAGRASLLAADSRAWVVIAGACGVWLCAQLVWTWIEMVDRRLAPFPSVADYGFLAFAPLFALGIAMYRPLRGPVGVTVQQVCNLLILLCGAAIAVPIILHGTFSEIDRIDEETLIGIGYSALYMPAMLFGFFCYAVFRWGRKRQPLMLLVLGLAAHALVMLPYSASVLDSSFSSSSYISVLWLVGFGFVSWASYEYRANCESIAAALRRGVRRQFYVFDRLLPVTVVAILVIVAFLNYRSLEQATVPWLIPPAIMLIVVLVFREVWSFQAELSLHRTSEQAVAALAASEREAQEARRVAEEANRAKSRFLAHMSHELRTPLNAVIGFSEILTQEMFGPIGERYREYSDSILQSGRHLLAVINDILDLSKVEAGHYELDEGLVDLAEIADQACGLLREQIAAARLSIQIHCPDDLPLLWADERVMRQVLLNLVGNAVKFTPSGGKIVISAREEPDGSLRVTVRDNGVGMSAADLQRAMVPFGQAASVLARRIQGTGLGLPLARQFTALHGGELSVESRPDEGTTVTIVIPGFRLRQPDVEITAT